jgi:ABC-type glycerol-3-phosphate transport system substrate-binding protein
VLRLFRTASEPSRERTLSMGTQSARGGSKDTGLIKPTISWWMNYNPAYSAVLSEQIWSQAEANITQKNMTPEQAAEEAVGRIKTIFERFKIV